MIVFLCPKNSGRLEEKMVFSLKYIMPYKAMSFASHLFIGNIISNSKIIIISSTLLNTNIVATEALCFLDMITFIIVFNLMSESIHKSTLLIMHVGEEKGKYEACYFQNRTLPFLKLHPFLSLNISKF